ncbi:enoyl-CoA hydratase/isomerase family protein [Enterovirga rhinocerotis]|uniref:Enoyl-CoA hydratase n=1 Tax=Enterovirga rhinocerotis TaxID=1339210 RepID=A0A4R7BV23_9HYPH|nr:enoyl-CoA hydratase/isomerase family protein [Enterovirga rhinocerotis]TDR88902.1 enoyl-CoA hydratase [Enterovirga rhinocerotis]
MSSSVNGAEVKVSEKQGSLVLTIDRPWAGNSISLPTAKGLREAMAASRTRTDLRGIVITGAGGKFFCTGGDLKAYRALRTPEELSETFGFIRDLLVEIEHHPLPVIAAIDGYALGGGAELALACDLRIASPAAKIGFPQAKLGLLPGWNGTERLVRAIGPSRATRLLLEAAALPAEEALALGLVDIVTTGADAADGSLDYLAGLTAAPLAIRAVKEAVRASRPAVSTETTAEMFARLWFTEDHREAELAFVEKRKPVFTGK